MNETYKRKASERLDAISGLSDSAFPLIYCDPGLTVIDVNKAASEVPDNCFLGTNMADHMSADDAVSVSALMYSKRVDPTEEGYSATVKLSRFGSFRRALVVPRMFLGKVYAEFRLFPSVKQMLRSYDNYELMLPVKPRKPEYEMTLDRSGNERVAGEINAIFANNMLSNIYSVACAETEKEEYFDVLATVNRVISDVSSALDFNDLKWKARYDRGDCFVFPVISFRNLISVLSLAIAVFSGVSRDKCASVKLVPAGYEAYIEFSTEIQDPAHRYFGDLIFPLVGKMFPRYETMTFVLSYLCELFGIGCYCSVSDDMMLTLKLVLSKDGISK
ncbi:MAG: hypothetical protein IKG80_02645, partial [Clostridia bacterium]|nr:hypothetical protein [Clostridia bacterium]